MDLVQWRNGSMMDPIREMERLQDEINDLFSLDRYPGSSGLFDRTVSPALDVVERDEEFVVTCDLPGVDLKDLDISVSENVLTIKGEKHDDKAQKDRKVYRKETWEGGFQRTLSMPKSIDSARTSASLKNGVLTITLPKREEVRPRQISVKVQ